MLNKKNEQTEKMICIPRPHFEPTSTNSTLYTILAVMFSPRTLVLQHQTTHFHRSIPPLDLFEIIKKSTTTHPYHSREYVLETN